MKAVAGSAPKEAGIKAFGIYNESGAIEEINGGSVEAVTYASQWAFAISNNANSRIGKISGGKFTADGIHQFNAPNMIALANEGAVDEISGGYFTAFSQTKEGGTFAIRNREPSLLFAAAFTKSAKRNASISAPKTARRPTLKAIL